MRYRLQTPCLQSFCLPTHSAVNEGKSAASFCCQVAAWFSDMFCNFYIVENHKIVNNATATKAGEKISADLGSVDF
jgi:hypothetical protein